MSDDFWNAHNQGRNGNARPVGGGPRAWRGYDQGRSERERQQQAPSVASGNTYTAASSVGLPAGGGAASSDSGNGVYGFVVLIFMGLCTWLAVEINDQFQWMDKNKLIGISLVVSYLVGAVIKEFLLKVFGAILALAMLGGLAYWGFGFVSDYVSKLLA